LIIQEKNARINIGQLPGIEVNKGQIRQVFQNILSNALKFSKADKTPEITINSKRLGEKSFESVEKSNGDFCLISIEDNGIGFDEKYVKNIFALFERLNSKDKYEGTGIGLSIAKKIIEKHNGLIMAKSKEGIGSEFSIILPIKQSSI
jgi:signal transduction histidine kinase